MKHPADTASELWMLITLPAIPTVTPLNVRSPADAML
jgi:hypothetical protein